jgi:hypothetical protein
MLATGATSGGDTDEENESAELDIAGRPASLLGEGGTTWAEEPVRATDPRDRLKDTEGMELIIGPFRKD